MTSFVANLPAKKHVPPGIVKSTVASSIDLTYPYGLHVAGALDFFGNETITRCHTAFQYASDAGLGYSSAYKMIFS